MSSCHPPPCPPRSLPALKPGDTIAFLSPSARLNCKLPLFVARATALLEHYGYIVLPIYTPESSKAGDVVGSIQSSIATRLSEIRDAFTGPSKAIICTIGGTTFTELLPALLADKELQQHIRNNPKIVVGYSDITGLHWFLHATTGLCTFYGPGVIPELGLPDNVNDNPDGPLAFCLDNLFRAIEVDSSADCPSRGSRIGVGDVPRSKAYYPRTVPFDQPDRISLPDTLSTPKWTWLRPGNRTGRLFGGCLTVVARLGGIRAIVPDWRGRIVFLETAMGEGDNLEKGNPIERVRAGFADLIAQGVFDEAAGLVVGRPFGYNTPARRQMYMDVITGLFCEKGSPLAQSNPFPILFGVDFGHTIPMVTLRYDAQALLNSERDKFAILETGVL
ncbi:Peptidase family S66 [Naviculisporaceae sp. PSN 640]